jgi:hypothetical protein
VDERGRRWEVFSDDRDGFIVQYATYEDCETGVFVLDNDPNLDLGSEFAGEIHETRSGYFGVPCELEFGSVSKTEQI